MTDTVADPGSALGHSFGEYTSNGDATCTADGTKTAKCIRCDVTDTVADKGSKLEHTPGKPVQKNVIAAGPGYPGSYDEVVNCTVCGKEISRETIVTPPLPVEEPPIPEEPPRTTHLELVYTPVDEDEEIDGVIVSEHPEMEETFAIVLDNLQQDPDNTKITIPGMEEVLNEEQRQVFDSLSIQEQMTLTLCALGYSENEESLSADGAQLLADISGNEEVLNAILTQFPIEEETVDGVSVQVVKIEILIQKDGITTFQRYIFSKDGNAWKLLKIEKGVYVEVQD